jgi:hypothetical protein
VANWWTGHRLEDDGRVKEKSNTPYSSTPFSTFMISPLQNRRFEARSGVLSSLGKGPKKKMKSARRNAAEVGRQSLMGRVRVVSDLLTR